MLPTKGSIKVNNKLINNYDFMRNFGNIGYCSQNTYLFEDTLKENILFGSSEKLNQIKYKKAIEIAQCQQFLGTNINKLSGGENRESV